MTVMDTVFHESGYVVVPGVFSPADIAPMRSLISDLVLWKARQIGGAVEQRITQMTADDRPHAGMAALAEHNAEAMRQVTDRLIVSGTFLGLAHHDRIRAIAAQYTAAPSIDFISLSEPFFRVDVPRHLLGERNLFSLPWHQESGYYTRAVSHTTSIVLNLAIYDCAIDNGCIELVRGSHRQGALQHEHVYMSPTDKRHFRAVLPESVAEPSQIAYGILRAGDVLVNHFNTIHRSGVNDSERVRYTMLVRASNMLADDFTV